VPLTRANQVVQLVRPTARAMPWGPLLIAGLLGAGYVRLQAPDRYVDHVIWVMRLAGLFICVGAAFILDDPTEDTIGHVPTPLILRRLLRVALALPAAGLLWLLSIGLAGSIPDRYGGPLPVNDLTLEASAVFVVALAASSLGARLASDRLGGIVASPIVLALVAVALFLPEDQRLIIGSPHDPYWDKAHTTWKLALAIGGGAFVFLNGDPGRRVFWRRVRAAHVQSIDHPGN